MAKLNNRPSILILTSDTDEASDIVKALHGAKVPVRGMFTQQLPRLVELSEKHRSRVLIACISEQIPVKSLIEHFQLLRRTIPLVVVGGQSEDPLALIDLLRTCMATLIVSRHDDAFIETVRYHVDHATRGGRIAQLERALGRCEDEIIACSDREPEPSAWIRDGRLLTVNQTYRQVFAIPATASVEGQRFSESVAANQRAAVDGALDQGRDEGLPSRIRFLGGNGQPVFRGLRMGKGYYQSVACLRVALPAAPVVDPASPSTDSGNINPPSDLAGRGRPTDMQREGDDLLITRIERALREDGLSIAFQPVVSLHGDNQDYYSVLLRLLDENQIILNAMELLGPAARSGNLPAIDRWVVQNALDQLSRRRKKGKRISFFLSLSAETLSDDRLLIWICDALREFEARASWVSFQFLESDVINHMDQVEELANGLKRIKSRIAINGFGMADDPGPMLKRIKPQFVKFHPRYGIGLADDEERQTRLKQLAGQAEAVGAKTIVSAVEDARTLMVLWSAGISFAQGSFLQLPSASLDAAEPVQMEESAVVSEGSTAPPSSDFPNGAGDIDAGSGR